MKWFKYSIAALFAMLFCCPGGAASADLAVLEASEAESLTYQRVFAMYKRDIYDMSAQLCPNFADDDCAPLLAALATQEQLHMDMLGNLLEHYGIEDPLPSESVGDYPAGFLDDEMLNVRWYVGWITSYGGILRNVAYLEEMNVRDLRLAIGGTDEQLLVSEYTKLVSDDYVHLLKLASALYDDPLDYPAQLLSSEEVEIILLDAIDLLAEFTINSGLNDAWYAPSTDRQGFNITVFEARKTVFLTWFTYDTELPGPGVTANLGDPGQRWFTAQGPFEGSQAELVVYSASGGLFDAAVPVPDLDPVGSILLQFDDCTTGAIAYEFPGAGVSGAISIQRLASDNVSNCEMFSSTAPNRIELGGGPVQQPSGACWVSAGEAPTEFSRLFAVWGSAGSDVFAVGGSGTILHYDGTGWSPMTWGAEFGFEGVWGSSGKDVYAVGGVDGFGIAHGVILHYDGVCWRNVYSTTDYQFTDVWGSSSSDVFVATSRGPVLHYDGTNWTSMDLGAGPYTYIGGLWGTGASDVFAVGDDGAAWHYDGSNWQLVASVDATVLRRVWGSSARDVFAVGALYQPTMTEAAIWHYDGARWTSIPSDTESELWSVWGSGTDDVFVVGNTANQGVISRYDGAAWDTTFVPVTPTLQGVWGSGPGDVYVVGGGARNGFCCMGAGTILHFDGGSWTSVMESGRFK